MPGAAAEAAVPGTAAASTAKEVAAGTVVAVNIARQVIDTVKLEVTNIARLEEEPDMLVLHRLGRRHLASRAGLSTEFFGRGSALHQRLAGRRAFGASGSP